jgi:HK97 family phage portal protein
VRIVDHNRLVKYGFTEDVISRLAVVEQRSTLTDTDWWTSTFPHLFSENTTVPVNKFNALGIAAYRRGVELRAQGIAMMPLKKYKEDGNGRQKVYSSILEAPNSFQTWFEWEVWMNAMAVGRGNGLSYILRDQSFNPVQLIPFPNPDCLTPYVENSELWYRNTHPGFPQRIPGIDVVHYKGLTWDNPLWGISSIRYHSNRLGIILASEKTELNTSKSGGKKFAVSANNDITLPAQKLLKETLEMVMNDEAVSVALPAGGKIEELTLSPVDLDAINHYNMSVQDVNRMLGIPNSLNNLDGATKGSAEQEWQSFYSMTLMADATRNEAELKRKLLTEREKSTHYFKYSFQSMLRATAQERATVYGQLIRIGVMTPAMVQDREELPRTEGSDATYLDANLMPVDKFPEWIDAKINNLNSKIQPNPNGNNQGEGDTNI